MTETQKLLSIYPGAYHTEEQASGDIMMVTRPSELWSSSAKEHGLGTSIDVVADFVDPEAHPVGNVATMPLMTGVPNG